MPPRVHNALSYSLTIVVFVVVAFVRAAAASTPPSTLALGAAALWCLHFVRRTLESAFVHRYGRGNVGASDYVTEYLYYWGFAYWNASTLFRADFHAPPAPQIAFGIALFVLAESGNSWAHLTLRKLRSDGSTARRLPSGFLFEWVSSPHYLCEILSWIGFALTTGTLAAWAFALLGAGILAVWAQQRHKRYRQDFERYPERRRALLPFLF